MYTASVVKGRLGGESPVTKLHLRSVSCEGCVPLYYLGYMCWGNSQYLTCILLYGLDTQERWCQGFSALRTF